MPTRILIVEDHDLFRRNLHSWLEGNFPTCTISEAASGEEALEIVRQTLPHIILMDITLPHMNGIATLRQIKAINTAPAVIMLTVHQESFYRTDALEAGAAAYVAKQEMYTHLLPILMPLIGNGASR
ncbi:MAG TPA: response regulator transcription factor [Anaerolineae bacterium]|nr:response regulator transcription factor [Anaerolineae bacterium]